GGGAPAARMGGRPTHRHRARGRHRGARRAGREFPPDQAHQRGRDPPSHRPEGAAALRVPDGRRGRPAPGARGARHRDHGPGRAHRPSGAGRGVHVSLELQLVLLAWGTLVGLDLISVPQMMIARPIVAGPVAGAILGDVATGLALGVVFELFQYDVLPVGAARYPEYGPATVAAVSAAQAGAGTFGLGFGVLVGLTTGLLGGGSARGGHGQHAAPRGAGARPPLVRSRARRRHGRCVALVTPALGQSLLRLFTVQGSWNYERMQGIGVGVAEEPLLRPLVRNGD